MSESMREAVEGFERDREQPRLQTGEEASQAVRDAVAAGAPTFVPSAWVATDEAMVIDRDRPASEWTTFYLPRAYVTRADVLDLATAANDARQLAILTPAYAEEALARAARYDDLAARLGALVPVE